MVVEKKINIFLLATVALTVIAACTHIFFSAGHTYDLDGSGNCARAEMVYQSIKEGNLPIWSNKFYGGFALIQFYQPFFFLLAGISNFLFNNIITTVKVLYFLNQILSGLFTYLLVKEISDNQKAGLVAGLAYSLSPWHVFHVMVFARNTHSFIYALLPLPFYFYERYRKGKESFWRTAILGGLIFFLICGFHYGYTVFITYFFLLYLFLDRFRSSQPGSLTNNIKLLLITGLIAAGLSLFMTIPFIIEGPPTLQSKLWAEGQEKTTEFHVDSANFEALYTRRGRPVYHKGYIGVGFAVLSLLGVVGAFRRRRYVLIVLYGLAIFLVLGHQTSIYPYIPLIYTQQTTARLIIYQMFFMGILAGLGWDMIEGFVRFRTKTVYPQALLFFLVTALLVWDVSVMFNLKWRTDYYGMKPVYQNIKQDMEKRGDHQGRVAHFFINSGMDWMSGGILASIQTLETTAPSLRGFAYPASAFYSGRFINAGMEWLRDELIQYRALRSSADFLHLTDTAYMLFLGSDRRIKVFNFFPHTPVFASGNIIFKSNNGEDSKTLCSTIIPKMGLIKETATARILFSQEPIPNYQPLPAPHIQLLKYRQTVSRTYLRIQSDTDTYLRISHSYYPYLSLTLDGAPIPFYPTTLGFILVRLPTGTHTIEISPILSPLRKITIGIAILTFFSIAVAFFVLGKNRNTCLGLEGD